MKKLSVIFLLTIVLFSCGSEPREIKTNQPDKKAEELIRINKYLVGQDADKINGYIKRRGLNMQITQTGLRYQITQPANGKKVNTGDKVTLAYNLSLLDGTECYSSDKEGLKTFVVGKGGVEPGLEEGLLLLHEGDKALFIMMPHLAHGLVGDANKIPSRAIIVYEVELIQISQ